MNALLVIVWVTTGLCLATNLYFFVVCFLLDKRYRAKHGQPAADKPHKHHKSLLTQQWTIICAFSLLLFVFSLAILALALHASRQASATHHFVPVCELFMLFKLAATELSNYAIVVIMLIRLLHVRHTAVTREHRLDWLASCLVNPIVFVLALGKTLALNYGTFVRLAEFVRAGAPPPRNPITAATHSIQCITPYSVLGKNPAFFDTAANYAIVSVLILAFNALKLHKLRADSKHIGATQFWRTLVCGGRPVDSGANKQACLTQSGHLSHRARHSLCRVSLLQTLVYFVTTIPLYLVVVVFRSGLSGVTPDLALHETVSYIVYILHNINLTGGIAILAFCSNKVRDIMKNACCSSNKIE